MSKTQKRTGTSALYPGTFDPITNGHVDVIQRALEVFESINILVAHSGKKVPLFNPEERKLLIEKCFENNPRIKVDTYDGLLVDYAKKNNIAVILRGLRGISDFEYEFQLAGMNRRLAPGIETLFLTPAEQYTYISSSLIKEIASLGGDVTDFVHEKVRAALNRRMR